METKSPKLITIDNSAYYDIDEAELKRLMDDPVNKRKDVTDEELNKAMERALELFASWQLSVKQEITDAKEKGEEAVSPTGDKYFLGRIQAIVDEVDRPLCLNFTAIDGNPTPMLFIPERLKHLERKVILNRLEL